MRAFTETYQEELERFCTEEPDPDEVGDWVNRSIKWTLNWRLIWLMDTRYRVSRLITSKMLYSGRLLCQVLLLRAKGHSSPVQNAANISARWSPGENKTICFCVNRKQFYVLAADRVVDLHLTGDTQCLPLYRYTKDGERVSNITKWGLRQFREHYGDDDITAEDVFAYTYAALHDPIYRETYAVDLRRQFPRLPFQDEFREFVRMGQELLDLHIGFESVKPWSLTAKTRERSSRRKPGARLSADKERGVIVLDETTRLTGVPGGRVVVPPRQPVRHRVGAGPVQRAQAKGSDDPRTVQYVSDSRTTRSG